ncbi:MAG: DUF2170 family protein [Gammaproteobacteria bacterium]|nr:DUF2170 family protein [Gammaproteobacteria bacterium]
MILKDLAIALNGKVQDGYIIDVLPILEGRQGDISVLQVVVEGFDELPIYVTATEEQILCVTNLFSKSEISSELLTELNEILLKLSVNIPLSSIGLIDNEYVMFGAISVQSSNDAIAHELVTQSENALEALRALEEFLN